MNYSDQVLVILTILILIVISKYYALRKLKASIKRLLELFRNQDQFSAKFLVSQNKLTRYWTFEHSGQKVCDSFDFRNISVIEIEEFEGIFRLRLIFFNEKLIVQYSNFLTSQQNYDLDFNSYDEASRANKMILNHIKSLSKSKFKLKQDKIKSVTISFYLHHNSTTTLTDSDVERLIIAWNSCRKINSNRIDFTTIILISLVNDQTVTLWRNGNTIFELYNMSYVSSDLSFLDKYCDTTQTEIQEKLREVYAIGAN